MTETLQDVDLTLDGRAVSVRVDPDTPLLYVLRDQLGNLGTRFGCGEGTCGACMVIIDGRATASCNLPVSAAAGAEIDTIAGVDGSDPIVAAMLEAQAGQCGYCLPGIVMAAKALLAQNPAPSRREIALALDGNLCRCGAHLRIMAAIEAAAQTSAEAGR
jgi:aerobic-type carbon monoxide dehydrogenase small subunit (CoxS/CutS family)